MKILKKTGALFLIATLSVLALDVKAQATKEGAEQTVTKFASSFENITKSKDVNSILDLVSRDLFSTIINSSVADNFGLIRSTYQDFEAYLVSITKENDLSIQYKINKILKTNVRGKSAVIVCDISYQYKRGNTLLRKGVEATTFVLRHYDKAGWKIINFNVVNLEEELNVGQCVCEVFAATTGNYLTKTTVPAGASYESKIDEFLISRGQGGLYFITNGSTEYTWVRDGDIKKTDKASNKVTVVGRAVDELEAVMVILQNDIYASKCSEFRRRR